MGRIMLGILFVALAAAEGVTVTIPQTWIYGLLAAIFTTLMGSASKMAWPHVKAHFGSVARLRRAERALDEKSPGLWLAPSIPIEPPPDYERVIAKSIPIIVVANLKGGVGKTTAVANLIGHYGLKKNKRVLALDMDFQGSLSVVVLSDAEYKNSLEQQADGSPSKAAQLVSGRDAQWLRDTSVDVDGVHQARCVPSYYTLSIAENRVMVEWLIGKRKEDTRYLLANVLHNKAIQDRFDIILIDAPPRLTTACVQSLCAATHVLVPTILDGLSAEASGGFVAQLVSNEKIWPHLRLLGLFGNMTELLTFNAAGEPPDGRLKDYEADARQAAVDATTVALEAGSATLRAAQNSAMMPIECFIPDKTELGRTAGHGIAYRLQGGSQATQDLSRAFDRLGDEIDRRILASKKK